MLESFQVAFNAVMPLLLLLGVGWAAVRSGVTDRAFMNRLNTLNFKLFFPTYSIDDTTLVKMLEEKGQSCVEHIEEVTIHTHIVDEFFLFCTSKSS